MDKRKKQCLDLLRKTKIVKILLITWFLLGSISTIVVDIEAFHSLDKGQDITLGDTLRIIWYSLIITIFGGISFVYVVGEHIKPILTSAHQSIKRVGKIVVIKGKR